MTAKVAKKRTTRGRPRNEDMRLAREYMNAEAFKIKADVFAWLKKAAQDGEPFAMQILINRLWPTRRGTPLNFPVPDIRTREAIPGAIDQLLDLVGNGTVTPDEAVMLKSLIELKMKAFELDATLTRLDELEAKLDELLAGNSGKAA